MLSNKKGSTTTNIVIAVVVIIVIWAIWNWTKGTPAPVDNSAAAAAVTETAPATPAEAPVTAPAAQ